MEKKEEKIVPNKYSSLRASGKTTRRVDACVQELYTTGSTTCLDHYGTRPANERLFELVARRLHAEHEHDVHKMSFFKHSFTIKLNKA